ncbi:hypothetical protein NNC19_08115, partial [Clostridium sp. SHJSY1]|uniref:hypothetical protein n=1 Tax=Clostridium sp. SHJSY1 TaxID=2942483 RepID=UPI00287538F4
MTKKSNLNSIEQQIKKLQEKKKAIRIKKEKDIGKYLLKSWKVSSLSTKEIFDLIDKYSPQNSYSSSSENDYVNNDDSYDTNNYSDSMVDAEPELDTNYDDNYTDTIEDVENNYSNNNYTDTIEDV